MRNFIVAIALVAAGGMVNCDAVDSIAEAAGLDTEQSPGSCGISYTTEVSSENVTIGACLEDADGGTYNDAEIVAANTAHDAQCTIFEATGTEDADLASDDSQCPEDDDADNNVVGTCTYTLEVSAVSYDYNILIYAQSTQADAVDAAQSAGEILCDLLDFGVDTTWTTSD